MRILNLVACLAASAALARADSDVSKAGKAVSFVSMHSLKPHVLEDIILMFDLADRRRIRFIKAVVDLSL